MADFDVWARYYDLIHEGLPGEAEFFVGQAVRLGGRSLELGCGTGRIAVAMAMSGAEVVGLDNSEAMLDVCREKLAAVSPVTGRLDVTHADMASFDLGEEFKFIALAYRGFMHLHGVEQQLVCLERIRSHLKEDGVFILSTWVPDLAILSGGGAGDGEDDYRLVGEYDLGESKGLLRHFQRYWVDMFRQRMVEEHLVEEVGADGEVIGQETLPLVRVWTSSREMGHLVRRSGFAVEAVFGDFDCGPLGPDSTEMIWVLRKG
jgi:SAM-dependent methyltransferase